MIAMIAAVDNSLAIADSGGVPWRGKMPHDVAWFRINTENKIVVMGGGFYKELSAALPNRQNWVLTRSGHTRSGFRYFDSIDDLKEAVLSASTDVMISGGGSIYEQLMPMAQILIITHVDTTTDAPTAFFPSIDPEIWSERTSITQPADNENAYAARYVIYERLEGEV